MPVVRVTGWEGDDILGTVAGARRGAGLPRRCSSRAIRTPTSWPASSRAWSPRSKGITDVAIYGPAEVRGALRRDARAVHRLPGPEGRQLRQHPRRAGRGRQDARRSCCSAYGSLEGIYEHIDELQGQAEGAHRRTTATRRLPAARWRPSCATWTSRLTLEARGVSGVRARQAVTEAFSEVSLQCAPDARAQAGGRGPRARRSRHRGRPGRCTAKRPTKLVDAAVESGEQVGVAFVDAEQESLFGGGSVAGGVRFARGLRRVRRRRGVLAACAPGRAAVTSPRSM